MDKARRRAGKRTLWLLDFGAISDSKSVNFVQEAIKKKSKIKRYCAKKNSLTFINQYLYSLFPNIFFKNNPVK